MSADTNVQIVDEIMGCITQTDVWFEALQNDPADLSRHILSRMGVSV